MQYGYFCVRNQHFPWAGKKQKCCHIYTSFSVWTGLLSGVLIDLWWNSPVKWLLRIQNNNVVICTDIILHSLYYRNGLQLDEMLFHSAHNMYVLLLAWMRCWPVGMFPDQSVHHLLQLDAACGAAGQEDHRVRLLLLLHSRQDEPAAPQPCLPWLPAGAVQKPRLLW